MAYENWHSFPFDVGAFMKRRTQLSPGVESYEFIPRIWHWVTSRPDTLGFVIARIVELCASGGELQPVAGFAITRKAIILQFRKPLTKDAAMTLEALIETAIESEWQKNYNPNTKGMTHA